MRGDSGQGCEWGLIWVRSCAGLAQHCWSAVDVSITSLLLIWFISTANLTIPTRKREAPRIICHQSLSLHRNPWTLQNLSIIVMGKAEVFVQNLSNVAAFKTTGTRQSHHHHDPPRNLPNNSKQLSRPCCWRWWQQQQHRISVGEIICDVSYSSSFVLRVILKWFITRKNAHSQIILSLL